MRQQQFEAALRAILTRLRKEDTAFGRGIDPDYERLSGAVLEARIIAAKALEEAENDRRKPDHR